MRIKVFILLKSNKTFVNHGIGNVVILGLATFERYQKDNNHTISICVQGVSIKVPLRIFRKGWVIFSKNFF